MSNEPAPEVLGEDGKAVWRNVVSTYDLRVDELVTLEDVCAITDMIAELEAAWIEDGRPKRAKGSTGQPVIDPLIGEIRAQRAARNALWRQLKLPDDAAPADASDAARRAASSRWSRGS